MVHDAWGKDCVFTATKRDIAPMNASQPKQQGNPKETTAHRWSETLKLPPHLHPLSLLSHLPCPLICSSKTSPPRENCLKIFSRPWKFVMRMMKKTWPLPPPSLMIRVFDLGSHLNIVFPWFVPCTSSPAKWMNCLSSYQTSYQNTNCWNHCPHRLQCHRKFHWHWPPIQSQLPIAMTVQTNPSVQCRWNSQCQRNHWMEGLHRHPLFEVQRNHWPNGSQSRLSTSNLGNALVA